MTLFQVTRNGLSYAARILIGCLITWWILSYFHDTRKIWALISVIIVTDTNQDALRDAVISRIINTLAGCLIGLAFLYFFGVHTWVLMVAITTSVLISTSFRNYPSSWKLAPVTVIIVFLPPLLENTAWKDAMSIALYRTGEVFAGSFVAFALALVFRFSRRIFGHAAPQQPTADNKMHE